MTNQEASKVIKDGLEDMSLDYIDIEQYEALTMAIKALEQESSGDAVSRQAVDDAIYDYSRSCDVNYAQIMEYIDKLPSVNPQEPKTGHWSRKTKVDAYDIAGVKTWGIKCQCDRCDFTTIVVEDFGYYKYCPNCGYRMIPPQEERDKE